MTQNVRPVHGTSAAAPQETPPARRRKRPRRRNVEVDARASARPARTLTSAPQAARAALRPPRAVPLPPPRPVIEEPPPPSGRPYPGSPLPAAVTARAMMALEQPTPDAYLASNLEFALGYPPGHLAGNSPEVLRTLLDAHFESDSVKLRDRVRGLQVRMANIGMLRSPIDCDGLAGHRTRRAFADARLLLGPELDRAAWVGASSERVMMVMRMASALDGGVDMRQRPFLEHVGSILVASVVGDFQAAMGIPETQRLDAATREAYARWVQDPKPFSRPVPPPPDPEVEAARSAALVQALKDNPSAVPLERSAADLAVIAADPAQRPVLVAAIARSIAAQPDSRWPIEAMLWVLEKDPAAAAPLFREVLGEPRVAPRAADVVYAMATRRQGRRDPRHPYDAGLSQLRDVPELAHELRFMLLRSAQGTFSDLLGRRRAFALHLARFNGMASLDLGGTPEPGRLAYLRAHPEESRRIGVDLALRYSLDSDVRERVVAYVRRLRAIDAAVGEALVAGLLSEAPASQRAGLRRMLEAP